MTTLCMERVRKGYRDTCVVSNASISFDDGLHLIEGVNGAGKTTLLDMIAGFVRPTSGAIRLDGVDISKGRRTILGRIAMASAQPEFFGGVTVDDALRLHSALCGRSPGKDVYGDFDPFTLRRYAGTRFGELSLGWKKRVILHMAFAADADVLVLDEPTVGLDVASGRVVASLLQERGERRVTVLTCHEPTVLGLAGAHRYLLEARPDGSVLSAKGILHEVGCHGAASADVGAGAPISELAPIPP